VRRARLHVRGIGGALALGALLCAAASCGKVGAPQPPLGRAEARPGQLVAVQVGSVIRLSWSAPNLDLRENEGSAVRRADVYRFRQTRDSAPLGIGDEFEESADIVGFLDYDALRQQLKGETQLVFEDRLDLTLSTVLTNTRFQYAVRYVDARNRPQGFSNVVSVEPVPGIARPPTDLRATERQDEVVLVWSPPVENIDGSAPAQVIGYNVYRAKPNAERLGRPLNDRPLADPAYTDRNFLYQTPYVYVVRSVSQGPDQTVESSDSDRLEVTPRDRFAPATPTNVTVASAGGVVSLFWPTNREPDVVGYIVSRSEGGAGGPWTRLTEKPVTRTTFRDERVRTGTRYAYRLTAVDRYGNESAPSEPVSETASP
jgi:hypothetical protein